MADHPTPPMIETVVSWVFGGGGLIALGGGLKWAWDKIAGARATREAKLEAREAEYVTKIEQRLKALETEFAAQAKVVERQGSELERHRIALMLLVADTHGRDPNASVLDQVRTILGDAFPVDSHIPKSMTDLAQRIE